jgi:DNA polymerase III epsilon subunit family exonuclease
VERERDLSLLDEVVEQKEEEYAAEIRRFSIEDFKKIDGGDTLPTEATYIADVELEDGNFFVCGEITYIEERAYVKKNEETGEEIEKCRFSVTIDDKTGLLRMTYFPKKATLEKVRELKQGDKIVVSGCNEEYKGSVSFKAGKINYGHAPEGFEPVAKKSKPVPKYYHTITPEKYIDYTQAGLFENLEKPAALTENTFVVFDLETTGLVHQPSMGKMDKIIEIGAVKIVGGEIVEKFSSFVACSEKLPAKIVELTGIHDEDLRGAPSVDKIIPDFFKFVDGAYLVGHNVNFDYDFIKYYGKEQGYHFSNRAFDTVRLAQELLRDAELANYKLNTVADHYGFIFNHHRAYDDAAVTAKIFMELIKKKGSLPL